jgi:hypothetical protein
MSSHKVYWTWCTSKTVFSICTITLNKNNEVCTSYFNFMVKWIKYHPVYTLCYTFSFYGFCLMHVSVHIVFNSTDLTLISFVFLCLIFYPTIVNVDSSLFVSNKLFQFLFLIFYFLYNLFSVYACDYLWRLYLLCTIQKEKNVSI